MGYIWSMFLPPAKSQRAFLKKEKKNSSKARTTAVTFTDPHGLLTTVHIEMFYIAEAKETNNHTQFSASL